MSLPNAYEDERRAASYAGLGFPGTYYLAYRDLPELLSRHVHGDAALDFGCGTGRSTRFLRELGFDVVGVDVSAEMLARARELDPGGRYLLLGDASLDDLPAAAFDVVLAAYPFDNIGGEARRVALMAALRRRLAGGGALIIIASAPELYTREWTSFTTRDFPANRTAGSGEHVRIVMRDVEDSRPIDDLLWHDDDYRDQLAAAGLVLVETHRPLGRDDEPFEWINETRIAPWALHVAQPAR
jgi:SAM-dependent methyltransferase